CPICLEISEDPKAIIYCGHILCDTCFRDYSEKSRENEQIQCPYCRQSTLLSNVVSINLIYKYHQNAPKCIFPPVALD
ncbi:hypothetical protein BC936DRAFT_144001, partial [Jimgerdemannia flammicorona]